MTIKICICIIEIDVSQNLQKRGATSIRLNIFQQFSTRAAFCCGFLRPWHWHCPPIRPSALPPTGTQNPQRWNFQFDIQDATNNFILWYCVVSYDIVLVLHGIFIVLHGIARGCFVMYGIALYRIK